MQEHTSHTLPSSPPTRIKTTPSRSWRAGLVLAALALLAVALSARHARAASSCINVSGALQVVPNTNAATVTGDLAGVIIGQIDSLEQSGNGALHATAHHTWYTPLGELYDVDEIAIAPVAPPVYHVNNHMTIVGGTGIFAGATGEIHVQGLIDLTFSGLDDRVYHGRICLQ
jgi:hypothetical protein